jgi:hypothetical protein
VNDISMTPAQRDAFHREVCADLDAYHAKQAAAKAKAAAPVADVVAETNMLYARAMSRKQATSAPDAQRDPPLLLSMNDWAEVLIEAITMATLPLQKRIEQLEAKLAAWKYTGVFEEGRTYQPGNHTTQGGSTFVCLNETTQKPGDGSGDWQLTAKRGCDGKDGAR